MASEHDGGDEVDPAEAYCEVSLVLDDSMIWACPVENEGVQIFLSENHSLSLGRESAEIVCRTLARYLSWDVTVAASREQDKIVALTGAVMQELHRESVIEQVSGEFNRLMGETI